MGRSRPSRPSDVTSASASKRSEKEREVLTVLGNNFLAVLMPCLSWKARQSWARQRRQTTRTRRLLHSSGSMLVTAGMPSVSQVRAARPRPALVSRSQTTVSDRASAGASAAARRGRDVRVDRARAL